uniref:Uncharacterized protein n=1 Tax=Acrobeloides nanus TaxID=290746 RepID=A0A914D524_9BILA
MRPDCRNRCYDESELWAIATDSNFVTTAAESSNNTTNSTETARPNISTSTSTPTPTASNSNTRGASPFRPPMFAPPPGHQPPFAFVRITRPTTTINLRPRPFVCMHAPRPTTVTLRPAQNHVHHASNCMAGIRISPQTRVHAPCCPNSRSARPVNAPQPQRLVFTPVIRVVRHVHCNASPNGRRVQVQPQSGSSDEQVQVPTSKS